MSHATTGNTTYVTEATPLATMLEMMTHMPQINGNGLMNLSNILKATYGCLDIPQTVHNVRCHSKKAFNRQTQLILPP